MLRDNIARNDGPDEHFEAQPKNFPSKGQQEQGGRRAELAQENNHHKSTCKGCEDREEDSEGGSTW